MARYAQGTSVSVDRTVAQIRQLLDRFGADRFAVGHGATSATLAFVYQGRPVRFDLILPDRNSPRFHVTPTGRTRKSSDGPSRLWDAECRAKWRSLHLYVKASIVAIEDGLVSFDRAFLHDIVMPGGQTVGQRLLPSVIEAVTTGKTPTTLQLTYS